MLVTMICLMTYSIKYLPRRITNQATKHSKLALERLALIPPNCGKEVLPDEHLTKSIYSGTWSRMIKDDISVTISTRFDTPSSGRFTHPYLRNLGSVNNTIVHECVHWDQHRKAFELERLYNRDATQIKCLVIGGSKGSSDRTAADWMEWQANSLAPLIQMPIGSFKTKAAEFVRKFQREMKAAHIVDVMEAVIDALATFFVVSRHAAKMRMVDAGYEEAIGAFTYIDGHYVKPHAFKKGSLQKDQTYCISADDAQIIAFSDMRLAAQSQKGSYIYVDSHMCLNDPKYVTRDENNTVQMTDYGRLHIDECCLAFKLKIKATNKYGEEFYKECVLFRDVDSGIVFQTTFAKEVWGRAS